MAKERLQKILAAAGIDSRRKCEELILTGDVSVNGKVVDTLPAFADAETDEIKVNGRRIKFQKKVYFLLNKQKGVICTNDDSLGRVKAVDIINCKERIFCIGRLDADSAGIIILTNDTALANRLTHPKYQLAKTYITEVEGSISPHQVEKLKSGIWLAEGKTQPAFVKILKKGKAESFLEIRVKQGLNRQVRRMLAKVGLKVKSLKRTKIGKISAAGLGVGRFRELKSYEIEYLKKVSESNAL